jgi:hypothetical protein
LGIGVDFLDEGGEFFAGFREAGVGHASFGDFEADFAGFVDAVFGECDECAFEGGDGFGGVAGCGVCAGFF